MVENLPARAKDVYNIFSNFFGEDKVDIQGFTPESHTGFILIYFPSVRITNEFDKYVDINELYVKVNIDNLGRMDGRFSMNRADYPLIHFLDNYMHSHITGIPKDDFTVFQNPCTGSGPINNTIASLNRDFDVDLWNLFCLELSKYVTVESISGVPYHRLEEIGASNRNVIDSTLVYTTYTQSYYDRYASILIPFTQYLLESKILTFNFVNGNYSIAESDEAIIIKLSNLFIKWYNVIYLKTRTNPIDISNLESRDHIKRVFYSKGKFYSNNGISNISRAISYNGSPVCYFKGKPVNLVVHGELPEDLRNSSIILSPKIVSVIITKILNIVNYKYGREEATSDTPNKEIRFV